MTILEQLTGGLRPHLDTVREQLQETRREIVHELSEIREALLHQETDETQRLERLLETVADASTLSEKSIRVPQGWEWTVENIAAETSGAAGLPLALRLNGRFLTALPVTAAQGNGNPTASAAFKFRALPGDEIYIRAFGGAAGDTWTVYLRGTQTKASQQAEV